MARPCDFVLTMGFREEVEEEIESIFRANVAGRIEPAKVNAGHDGEIGHWLEDQFGVSPNNNGAADFKGYELKKDTSSKTTFGDWSADRYLFSKEVNRISRDDFIRVFGSPNPKKNGRFSWSGSCVPKVVVWNSFGQKLHVSEEGNIYALYDYAHDLRPEKGSIVPPQFHEGVVSLAVWLKDSLREKVEQKFDVYGWFSVRRDKSGKYDALVFGQRIDFNLWINSVRLGHIYLDSGMIEGNNKRPYSSWRANNTFWDALIVRTIR